MSLNFSNHILFDYWYKQNPDGSYIFNPATDDFELRNKNDAIDAMLGILNQIYANIITQKGIQLHEPDCNVVLLDQALYKYSRDIYGGKRLQARINNNKQLTTTSKNNLLKFNDYGLKIDSTSPYIHRQVAVLLYWLSVIKPFSIEPTRQSIKALGFAGKFHNEYISYLLVQAALQLFNLRLKIHEDKLTFNEFLYDLHYRNLSRSSLEFYLNAYITEI
ncbi:MAG: hypothetical protein LBI04_02035 [Treponema sp.]|nr:hypothetical protein [Treponema sp.]